jgi:anti-sigma regulatory factor (Ser/Thr protein kinase)
MATTSTATRFAIDLPADPAYLSTARIFLTAVARHYGAPDETVEDLKVAVSEACSAFLRYGPGDEGSVHVEVGASSNRLTVTVSSPDLLVPEQPDAAGTPTPRGLAASLGMDVLQALFEDSEVVPGEPSSIRFSTPL